MTIVNAYLGFRWKCIREGTDEKNVIAFEDFAGRLAYQMIHNRFLEKTNRVSTRSNNPFVLNSSDIGPIKTLQYSNHPGPCTKLGDSVTTVKAEKTVVYALKVVIVRKFVVTIAKLALSSFSKFHQTEGSSHLNFSYVSALTGCSAVTAHCRDCFLPQY